MNYRAELEAFWFADLGDASDSVAVLTRLLKRYDESHRHYHTARHVLEVRRSVGRLSSIAIVSDVVAVNLAAWFHDAIYDPTSTDNEQHSAQLARSELDGLVAEASVARVEQFILATQRHEATCVDETVLLDADLAVLGADPAAYDAYVRGVRAEYQHVSDVDWLRGRTAVLSQLLQRSQIYFIDDQREANARANLSAELATLSATL